MISNWNCTTVPDTTSQWTCNKRGLWEEEAWTTEVVHIIAEHYIHNLLSNDGNISPSNHIVFRNWMIPPLFNQIVLIHIKNLSLKTYLAKKGSSKYKTFPFTHFTQLKHNQQMLPPHAALCLQGLILQNGAAALFSHCLYSTGDAFQGVTGNFCRNLCRNKCFCKINRHNGRVQQQAVVVWMR